MGVSRRQAIRSIGSMVAISGSPSVILANSTVRLPVLRSKYGIVKEKHVSKEWNDHKLLVRQVRSSVAERFLPRDGVKQVGIVGGDGEIGGQQRLAIEVDVVDEATGAIIPSAIDGIAVKVREARNLAKICYNEAKFSDTPGGVPFRSDESGTTGAVIEDSSGKKYMLTAAHIASDQCTNINGETVNQWGNSWGKIADHSSKNDWAAVEKTNSNFNFDSKIKLEDSTRIPVDGWVTQSGLETYVGSETVEKMGVTTGHTAGELRKIAISGTDGYCTDWDGEGFESQANAYFGDSGGPCWYYDDSSVGYYMIGHFTETETRDLLKKTCNGDYMGDVTQGYQAEALVNSTDYVFDSP